MINRPMDLVGILRLLRKEDWDGDTVGLEAYERQSINVREGGFDRPEAHRPLSCMSGPGSVLKVRRWAVRGTHVRHDGEEETSPQRLNE